MCGAEGIALDFGRGGRGFEHVTGICDLPIRVGGIWIRWTGGAHRGRRPRSREGEHRMGPVFNCSKKLSLAVATSGPRAHEAGGGLLDKIEENQNSFNKNFSLYDDLQLCLLS